MSLALHLFDQILKGDGEGCIKPKTFWEEVKRFNVPFASRGYLSLVFLPSTIFCNSQ